MKGKEDLKTLTLHIIGLVVHMSTQKRSRGSFLARILKKDISELKNYFKELGLVTENTEKTDKRSGKKV